MRTRRRHTGVQLATALTLASLAPSDARAGQSFIQTYIDAQGGCASAAGPLAFVLAGGGLQAPFGKLAGDWTDTDLAALPAILSACERTAARVTPYLAAEVRGQARELETRAPQIVAAARAERARQGAQLQARRDLAQARIEAARRQADLPAAGPEDDVRRLEAEAGRAEAQARAAVGYRDRALREAAEQRPPAPMPPREMSQNEPGDGESRPATGPTTTFAFDAPSFRRMYDRRLRGDGDGGIEDCAEQGMNYVCRFDDAPFRKSVEAFRKLDLVRGSFSSKLGLSVVSRAGKASSIVLTGDRADPMNLFGFVGKAASLIKTLEPGIAEGAVQDLLSAGLGLTRGDDDSTIGAERTVVRGAYVAQCRSTPSRETTAMTCTFEPRS
ncbi:hypothetical protein [Methylobacterium sp. WL2]|uniref:hypothetical protein n=2 Tax=unclassified Methylobacterium TaxID=2615210 RepID=UPI0011C8EF09|nr:hypothetical protein [Methylobacterium sp. WL2]TXN57773.1 hypothetical protein FV241_09955 [Methylobacterium sp. WL2]